MFLCHGAYISVRIRLQQQKAMTWFWGLIYWSLFLSHLKRFQGRQSKGRGYIGFRVCSTQAPSLCPIPGEKHMVQRKSWWNRLQAELWETIPQSTLQNCNSKEDTSAAAMRRLQNKRAATILEPLQPGSGRCQSREASGKAGSWHHSLCHDLNQQFSSWSNPPRIHLFEQPSIILGHAWDPDNKGIWET